ncbi:MAG: hypothetical protein ABI898_02395 [Sphingomonadales bacterium]
MTYGAVQKEVSWLANGATGSIKKGLYRSAISVRQAVYDVVGKAKDLFDDRAIAPKIARLKASAGYAAIPKQRILVAGVQTARRPGSIDCIFATMSRSRHDLVLAVKDVGGVGKLDNINLLLVDHDLSRFDWVWMIDDDVELPDDFTDVFVAMCTLQDYQIAGPAHRAWSYSGHDVTVRRTGLLAHRTNFVEVGPITAFHKSVFDMVLPLPGLRFGWGIDIYWSRTMEANNWRMGIVDAAALRHTSPVAVTYDWMAARDECEAFLADKGIDPKGALQQRVFETVAAID